MSATPARPDGPLSSRAESPRLSPPTSRASGAARLSSTKDSATSSTRSFSTASRQGGVSATAAGDATGGEALAGVVTRLCQFTLPSRASVAATRPRLTETSGTVSSRAITSPRAAITSILSTASSGALLARSFSVRPVNATSTPSTFSDVAPSRYAN